MRHFKFTLTNGVDQIGVDIMKDTLGNAIDTIQSIYGDRYAIHAIESPLYCPPANRRKSATVEDSRFTSRPGCGITNAWDNN